MVARRLLESISERLRTMAHAETVYGEPPDLEGRTVITLASATGKTTETAPAPLETDLLTGCRPYARRGKPNPENCVLSCAPVPS